MERIHTYSHARGRGMASSAKSGITTYQIQTQIPQSQSVAASISTNNLHSRTRINMQGCRLSREIVGLFLVSGIDEQSQSSQRRAHPRINVPRSAQSAHSPVSAQSPSKSPRTRQSPFSGVTCNLNCGTKRDEKQSQYLVIDQIKQSTPAHHILYQSLNQWIASYLCAMQRYLAL